MAKTIWITGLAGAGKSSIARTLYTHMKEERIPVVLIDGDNIREIFGNDLGHDIDDRIRNAYRIANMCHFLNEQGIDVVCATMSLYPEVWDWCKEHIENYIRVYIKVNKEFLVGRDQKQLYSKAAKGTGKNVVGMDLPFHEPNCADLIIENSVSSESFSEEKSQTILNYLKENYCETW